MEGLTQYSLRKEGKITEEKGTKGIKRKRRAEIRERRRSKKMEKKGVGKRQKRNAHVEQCEKLKKRQQIKGEYYIENRKLK